VPIWCQYFERSFLAGSPEVAPVDGRFGRTGRARAAKCAYRLVGAIDSIVEAMCDWIEPSRSLIAEPAHCPTGDLMVYSAALQS